MGALDTQLVDAYRLVDRLWAEHFAPRIPKDVDEWADAHRVLPAGSAEQGQWRTDRTPYARGIYKALSDSDDCEEVVLMCATQLVKSEAGLNWVGTIIDEMPAPTMIVQATVNTGKRYSRQRVAPMIQGSPSLRKKVASALSRDAANSASMKEFAGGVLIITGANSGAELASMPAKYIHFDEVDDYPHDVDGQGDPISVAKARQDTFRRRKRLLSSSPKRPKGESIIEAAYLSGTQYKYHVPCPHCSHMQELVWSHLKWIKDDVGEPIPESARYACEACGVLIEEHHKETMLASGSWVARYPERKVKSFHLNSLYSPLGWLKWSDLVTEWTVAQKALAVGNDEKLKAFINTRLAETVAEQAEQIEANELLKNAEDWQPDVVPMGGLIITCGVDVQDDRIECFAWAFGESDQMWQLKPEVIMGNPGEDETWSKLDAYLLTRYKHASGQSLNIEAVGIDTGGHYTHMVYNYVRRAHPARKIAALKGDNHKPGIPILGKASVVDVNWRGGVVKGGCKLWMVGVNTAKDLFHNRIKRLGMVHLSKHMPAEIFDQLTAEKRVAQRTARGTRYMWVKHHSNTRNEALDGAVYAIWCAERLGLSKYPQKVWEQIRERVQPRIGSLFDQPNHEINKNEMPPVVSPAPKKTVSRPQKNIMPRQSLLNKLRGTR
jgi:phage terminase large subunit GpA-like protein